MYSMNSFTTSAIPLNCDKNLRVSPCTFSAPQWHLRSLIVLLILCKTKKTQIIVIFLLKKSIQPPKIRSFVWKKLSFFTLKDLPASQKTEIVHEKMTKKCQKSYQKEHPAPQKPEVLHEKNVIFYSKKPPSLAKNSSCALIIFLFIFLLFFSFYFFFRFFFLDRKKLGFFLIENPKN